jgi:ribosomal protein S18 acetylase RimI-like enzyme
VGYHPDPYPALTALAVDPTHRRRGVATALVSTVLSLLPSTPGWIRIGGEAGSLWPGIPVNLPEAQAFIAQFPAHLDDQPAYDLTLTPAGFTPSAALPDLHIAPASPAEQATICAATPAHWPASWAQHYAAVPCSRLLLAHSHGRPCAALILGYPGDDDRFVPALGPTVATIACVGTFTTARNRGVGTALVSAATAHLFAANAAVVHIGWTTLLSFYGRLGYRPWVSYRTGRLAHPATQSLQPCDG